MTLIDNDTALEQLLKFKHSSNMNNKQLAEHFNVSPQMISAIFKGRRKVTRTIAASISNVGKLIDYIPIHSKSIEDIERSFDIPGIDEPCFAFVSIENTEICDIGDLLIAKKEKCHANDVVLFDTSPKVGTDCFGYPIIAIVRR